ncbi:MAG TPA: hypothetical protein VFG33_18115 [Kribbella sp.]|uniref:hypothetical protein n=1 Tax=Kribbella sp. TaxID=1871183 RepID=UPI002D78B78A|nr:hypothetical protein [Kribbella sp.]HET6295306.1 hypothetical protein [Kribbella sp.]
MTKARPMIGAVRRVTAVAAVAVVALVSFGQAPASAGTQFAPDHFKVCLDKACDAYVEGNIAWGQRTAYVSGEVVNPSDNGWIIAYFDAFAGPTKIDGTTRTRGEKGKRPIGFYIGKADLPGGIDRIRTQVCWDHEVELRKCGKQWNDIRD